MKSKSKSPSPRFGSPKTRTHTCPHADRYALMALTRMRIDSDPSVRSLLTITPSSNEAKVAKLGAFEGDWRPNPSDFAVSSRGSLGAVCEDFFSAAGIPEPCCLQQNTLKCCIECPEQTLPPHVLQLKHQLMELRTWGSRLIDSDVQSLGEETEPRRRKGGEQKQNEPFFKGAPTCPSDLGKVKGPPDPSHIRKALFYRKKPLGRYVNGVFQPNLPDKTLIKQVIDEKKRKGEQTVQSLIELFEGKGDASEHVRMLEMENRRLCHNVSKLQCDVDRISELKRAAEREKTAVLEKQAKLEEAFKLKEEAIEHELRSNQAQLTAMQRRLENAEQTLQKTVDELQAANQRAEDLEAALALKNEQHIKLCNKLNSVLASTKKPRKDAAQSSTSESDVEDNLTEALIRLERLAWACECLGNDKLVAIESYKRAKAKEALARSEVDIYKKYLDDLVEERDHFYAAAIKTKEQSVEKELYFRSQMEGANKKHEQDLRAKDKEIFVLKEKQLASEMGLRHGTTTLKRHQEFIEKQRLLLTRATNEYKTLTEKFQESTVEAQQLKRLSELILAYMAAHEGALRAASPPAAPANISSVEGQKAAKQATVPVGGAESIEETFRNAAGAKGIIDAALAATLSRQLGFAPSNAEIEALKEDTEDDVTLEDFSAFCTQLLHAQDSAEDLASVFQLWDPSLSGFVTKQQLQHILKSFGEGLNQEEIAFALDVIAGPGDKVNYLEFCQKLLMPNTNSSSA